MNRNFREKRMKMNSGGLILILVMIFTSTTVALDNGVVRKPPMGWNSWNVFRQDINEECIKAIADQLVSTGLAEAGYEYVVLDGGWYNNPNANEADSVKFPGGINALADYIHARGLKLGLYTNWVSRGHEIRDVNQWVKWGVDYMKHDAWKSYSTETKIWTDMRDAILATGHPMVYSVHFQDRDAVLGDPDIMNMWRFTNDMVPYFDRDKLPENLHWGMSTMDVINDMMRVAHTAGPGCWADADMLMVGVGDQTMDEWKTQFAMWCLLPSPLMIPSDLRSTPQEILDIYLNKEMIAVNQDTL
ncbi:glycoside hydrolase family 27 protein, partial [candidate division KSB1 bacterium]|nr:glycoside hydrolase family 27 protein [candidate division KSB1 bacterium]